MKAKDELIVAYRHTIDINTNCTEPDHLLNRAAVRQAKRRIWTTRYGVYCLAVGGSAVGLVVLALLYTAGWMNQ